MKKLILVSSISCLTLLGAFFLQSKKQVETPKSIPQAELFKHKKGAKKAADFWQRKRQNQITKEIDLKDVYKARKKANDKRDEKGGTQMSWDFLGPNNVGGRTRALLIDKDNSNRLYAGAVAGGIWLSDDRGNNWREHPQNASLECLAMSCVTQDKDGNIYFGTGEGFYFFSGEGSAGIPGEGIYKSSDNGETFELLAATRPDNPNNANDSWAAVHSLDAHPTQNIVYAGTVNGLYMTQDGGETWTKPINSSGDGYDISIGSNGVVHTIVGSRYYRSTNGIDFEDKTGNNPGDFPVVGNRKRIEVAPSNPAYVYAVAVLGSGCLNWVLQSKDGGDTWMEIGAGGSDFLTPMGLSSCQGNYNLAFGVDAVQEDRIFLGGLQFWDWKETGGWKQLDAGWWQNDPANLYFIHADKHDVVVDKNDPNTMYVISDGGITRSDNAQDDHPYFSTRNKNYNVTQFYGVGAGLDGKVIGGTQDNGTQFVAFNNNSAFAAEEVSGGDGGNAEISDINPNVMFAGIYYGNLFRSGTGGESFSGYFDEYIDSDGDGNIDGSAEFVTPFVLWEDLFNYILTGTESGKIITGSANGKVWMTNEALALSTTPRWYNIGKFSSSGYIVSCLAMSSDGNTVYAGTSGGQLLRIANLNSANFEELHDDVTAGDSPDNVEITQISLPGVNGQYINNIYTSNYGNRVYVALGNYGNDTNILMSDEALTQDATDFRNSFVSIQGDLPEMPVYDIIEVHGNESNIVAGTELGVWLGERVGNTFTWTPQNNGLGNVPVFRVRQEAFGQEVDIATPDCQVIYIATHGKGIYRSTSFTYPSCNTNIEAGFLGENDISPLENVDLNLYPNPASEQVTISFEAKKTITNAKIMLFDLQGRLMLEQKADNLNIGKHSFNIAINHLAKGNYVFVLMSENGKTSKKITIQ